MAIRTVIQKKLMVIFMVMYAAPLLATTQSESITQQQGRFSQTTVSVARQVKEHPFLIATAVWLAYYKGPRALHFLHELGGNFFIAVPVGGLVLHKAARMVLERYQVQTEDEDTYEVTIDVHAV